jgi:hypothetical protein
MTPSTKIASRIMPTITGRSRARSERPKLRVDSGGPAGAAAADASMGGVAIGPSPLAAGRTGASPGPVP